MRDDVVYWKTKRKIKDDLQYLYDIHTAKSFFVAQRLLSLHFKARSADRDRN
jgi:hypothetical protein